MLDRLTIERIDAAAGGAPIVTAFSGGGDSTALLHLLRERFGAGRLRAVIVDHALRAESESEAAHARSCAQALGITAVAVRLNWAGHANRAQQSARQQRYIALCEAARACGARVITLAHTADDQAETVFMRAAAGSSWRGLAGMRALASAPVWPAGRGMLVARPLLGARRQDLRRYLRAQRADWLEDPSNDNTAYERVRVRARLAALSDAGFDPMRLAALAARVRPLADAIDHDAALLIAEAARFEDARIVVSRTLWRGPAEVRCRALSALLAAAAGASREAPADSVARLQASLSSEAFRGATLAGAQIAPKRDALVFSRDRGALEGRAGGAQALAPLHLRDGVEAVWDGRLALKAHGADFVAHARQPEPRLVQTGESASAGVTKHWLLAERAAHALNQPPKRH